MKPSVKIRPLFGFYFKGFSKIVNKLPKVFLYKLAVRERYDVEIAFQYGSPTEFMVASTNKDAKHLVWIHTYFMSPRYKKLYGWYDKVVNVAKCNCNIFRKDTDSLIDVDYCYNPIDDQFIVKQGQEAITESEHIGPSFISVGRHSPEKGYDRLLDICSKLRNEGYSFHLSLIGSGPSHESLMQKSKDLGLTSFVSFLGAQDNPHKYTSKSDLFICSSFSEGYSTACTEAIMLGVPVLSTSVSGAEEIIFDSEAGAVVGMDDMSLYNGIKMVLDNPYLINEWKMSVNENKYKFSQEYRVQQLYKILGV